MLHLFPHATRSDCGAQHACACTRTANTTRPVEYMRTCTGGPETNAMLPHEIALTTVGTRKPTPQADNILGHAPTRTHSHVWAHVDTRAYTTGAPTPHTCTYQRRQIQVIEGGVVLLHICLGSLPHLNTGHVAFRTQRVGGCHQSVLTKACILRHFSDALLCLPVRRHASACEVCAYHPRAALAGACRVHTCERAPMVIALYS